jgi:hypothetical protein
MCVILADCGGIFIHYCGAMRNFAGQLGSSAKGKTLKGRVKREKSFLLELFSPNIFSIYKSPYICSRFGR